MSKANFLEKIKPLLAREFQPEETLQWLKIDIQVYWSWGVSKLTQFQNKSLFLTVNGFCHTGLVMITLNWNDTYIIRLLDDNLEVISTTTDVYCDMICNTVDSLVESNHEYYK